MPEPSPAAPILVVDDDPAILSAVAEVLSLEGYQVETAGNGALALEQVDVRVPSLVLLDMRMPVVDGWSFSRAIHARGLHLPLVVMTAAHNAASWAREIEADGFLPKPFEIDELLAVVRHHVPPARGTA